MKKFIFPMVVCAGLFSADAHAGDRSVYREELERYKPLYQTFGLSDYWTLLETGRCEEAKQWLTKNGERAWNAVQPKGAITKDAWQSMSQRGIPLCEGMTKAKSGESNVSPSSSQQPAATKWHKSLEAVGTLRGEVNRFRMGTPNERFPSRLEDILTPMHLPAIPTLYLPDHPDTQETIVYGGDICAPGGRSGIVASKLKDSGKWAYVNDPASPCFGTVFIDCIHKHPTKKIPWHDF